MIIDLYWARSEAAISETANKYGRFCAAIAMNILHSAEDAEECVSDTYLKTWDAIPPQRPTFFSAFLGKITRNLALNKYRAQRTKKRGGGELALIYDELEGSVPSGSNVEKEYEANLAVAAINAWLRSLDQESRIIFVRRYWYLDPIQTIARHFKMSESKVKSMLYRLRQALKAQLENEGVTL